MRQAVRAARCGCEASATRRVAAVRVDDVDGVVLAVGAGDAEEERQPAPEPEPAPGASSRRKTSVVPTWSKSTPGVLLDAVHEHVERAR